MTTSHLQQGAKSPFEGKMLFDMLDALRINGMAAFAGPDIEDAKRATPVTTRALRAERNAASLTCYVCGELPRCHSSATAMGATTTRRTSR